MPKRTELVILLLNLIFIVSISSGGCAQSDNKTTPDITQRSFTAADVAKLKWLEGTWKGMDGDKPFYERYRFEGDSKMIVEGLEEGTLKVTDASVYELKDGKFGHTDDKGRQSAATSITADAVQFAPVNHNGNSYRFERQPDGTWRAVLEWPANANRAAGQKVYKMEPYKAAESK